MQTGTRLKSRPRPLGFLGGLFQTPLYHPALAGTPPEEGNWNPLGGPFPTPLYHLGRLFQTRLYHLHPCRHASMQAGLRWNDDKGQIGLSLFRQPLCYFCQILDLSPLCHSGEGRNPVVLTSHSRNAGMTTTGTTIQQTIR